MKLKLTFLTLVLCALATTTNAQIFFTEDFEGTMSATTDLPTGWTETGLSTDGIWQTGNTAAASSPYLVFPTPTPTAGTTFAFTNDDACDCNKSVDRMILPVQNFTTYAAVELEADIYINGGYGETFQVDVSVDGGVTWVLASTFTANAAAWQNDQTVDLTAYAGLNNVLISFLYSDAGGWAFAAAVDNVTLEATVPSEDLFVVTTNGEYTSVPYSQMTSMDLSADVSFEGTAVPSLSDATLTANVLLDGTQVFTITSGSNTINSGDTINIFAGTYTPAQLGDYSIEYVVASASLTDTDPANDTSYFDFVVDTRSYARDTGVTVSALGIGPGTAGEIGIVFEVYNAAQMDSVHGVHNFTSLVVGDTIRYVVYDMVGGLPNAIIGFAPEYITAAGDIGAVDTLLSFGVTDLTGGTLMLSPGRYLVAAQEYASSENYALAMSNYLHIDTTVMASVAGGAWTTLEALGFPLVPRIHADLIDCSMMASTDSLVDPLCNGDMTGFAQVAGAGGVPGYTYQWGAAAGSQTTPQISGMGAGTYSVMITDTVGCTFMDTVVLNEPALLVGTIVDNGDNSATASATGGTPGYSYMWDASAGSQTTATATGLTPGSTYTVTITDTNNCSTTATITIGSNSLDELNAGNWTMYPNPANDVVNISVVNAAEGNQLSVIDAAGRVIVSPTQMQDSKYTLDVSNMEQGIYIVVITNGNTVSKKMLSVVK